MARHPSARRRTRSLRAAEYTGVRVAKLVKTKKRCCKSGPRCKRCPVVCKRLEKQGLAERLELRVSLSSARAGKKQLKAARARGARRGAPGRRAARAPAARSRPLRRRPGSGTAE